MLSVDAAPADCSTSGQCLTYDALGRMVEKRVGATYTQIVYDATGRKFAVMSGQTLQKAWVPLPGGGTAIYTLSGLAYYRHSDHWNHQLCLQRSGPLGELHLSKRGVHQPEL